MNTYTKEQISSMNYSYPWSGCITHGSERISSSGLYELHATGYADLNGRKYVSLPKGTKITEDIKRKYNIY